MSQDKAMREAGFTLVEMLVSLTLLALAAGMMLEGLGSGRRLWAGEAARTARGESVEAAQSMLRGKLERLLPTSRFEGATIFADISGGDRQLVFLAPPPDVERPAAARRYRLSLSDQGDLMLGAQPLQVDAGPGDVYTDQVLLRDVGGLDISYYGPDLAGGAPRWRTEWTRRATPPELVKVKLSLKSGDQRVWPDLIVQPAALIDTLCSVDPTTGSCRGRE
jgi:general secretion pathway protein J